MEEKKRCSKCRKNKSLDNFFLNKNSKDGHHHYCKLCHNNNSKIKYATDAEFRERRKKNRLKTKYNITYDEFINMLNEQNNKCTICDKEFKSIRVTFIDHDHTNGKVRGLLCPKCNNLLGSCLDNISILKSAILYLEKNCLVV